MINFLNFLIEAEEEGAKLKHIHHAEDRPLLHGEEGFNHAYDALQAAHHHGLDGLTLQFGPQIFTQAHRLLAAQWAELIVIIGPERGLSVADPIKCSHGAGF